MAANISQTVPLPTDVGALANRINFHTREMHSKVHAFMGIQMAFAMRHASIYRQGLLAFYHIFKTIESNIDRLMESPVTEEEVQVGKILKDFWCEEFRRSNQLVSDLELFYRDEYPTKEAIQTFLYEFKCPPRLQSFVDFIDERTLQDPCTILAYCHVLYNALFAGGQVVRSKLYRHAGMLPKMPDVSTDELLRRGTNFFTFSSEGTGKAKLLRIAYRRNYELSTREGLLEEQKEKVIDVSVEIFARLMDVVSEIAEINRKELMGSFSFKLLKFIGEEWSNSEKLSSEFKHKLVWLAIIANFLVLYGLMRAFVL